MSTTPQTTAAPGAEAAAEPESSTPPPTRWVLCHGPDDAEAVEQELLPLFPEGRARALLLGPEDAQSWAPPESLAPEEVLVAYLGARDLVRAWPALTAGEWSLALLRHPELGNLGRSFGVAANLADSLADLLEEPRPTEVDRLLCNGRPVFGAVVLGDPSTLGSVANGGAGLRARLLAAATRLDGLRSLRLRPFRLRTQADKGLDTAALGIVVVRDSNGSPLAASLGELSTLTDGHLAALVVAPRSGLQMAWYLLRSAFRGRLAADRPPPFVGLVQTPRLVIEREGEAEFWIDGERCEAQRLELTIEPRADAVILGRAAAEAKGSAATKERFRTTALPQGEARTELLRAPLPLLLHASTEDFAALYQVLRANAEPTRSFAMLMVLSTLLAALGLYADSAPVIIGAMILAPLMGPIVSLAMGLARQDQRLVPQALRTLALGLLLAVGCATSLSVVVPLETITDEIASRLRPNLLDLGVAVISGVAGAYAHAREEVARSLAGVAIAVALVPPLAVVGIGIGWWSWPTASGAGLLFLTNLVGILLAAGLTFLLLGFAPFRRARRGLAVAAVSVLVVGWPLGVSFARMVESHRLERRLDGLSGEGWSLAQVEVQRDLPLRVAADVLAREWLDRATLDAIDAEVERQLGRLVDLHLTLRLVR
jgi:uncharacterized hydrophobic protein (TIGR00271 family)